MGSRGIQSADADGPPSLTADYLRASPRLFENPLLDKLSRVHWSMPLFVYAPFMAALHG